MTVLLLDPRWPTMIPLEAIGCLPTPVDFAVDVPVSVRWKLIDVIDGVDDGVGTLVTFDESDASTGRKVFRAPSLSDPIGEARQIMARARSIGEWEAAQTHRSLLPFLQEETQEFAEAIDRGESAEVVRKELGDLLLQILFHAEIAEDFDFDDVAQSFVDKMHSRAPYLFDGTSEVVDTFTQEKLWAKGKRAEGVVSEHE
ncbi:MazG nucleotide pyrophosphohydrolase domain-containing protein [Corynebacterium tapiri]|uniref:Nucleoside triphosphate hydrolase n=1 Tax=Corynebacterium tapiri TaxID=1448266 RepID=A0A5C4U7U9_9CORY|nr:MazG nucleotide pyrophosphohydrolase domain-containing protein [Corynebacterium tapiri]TNM00480.1 nucleoside triphosphate hydrolase [Corynebacterium tapiri]